MEPALRLNGAALDAEDEEDELAEAEEWDEESADEAAEQAAEDELPEDEPVGPWSREETGRSRARGSGRTACPHARQQERTTEGDAEPG